MKQRETTTATTTTITKDSQSVYRVYVQAAAAAAGAHSLITTLCDVAYTVAVVVQSRSLVRSMRVVGL